MIEEILSRFKGFGRKVVAFEDEVSTESGSDRVIVLAISIIAIGFYPVATALGTDSMTSAGFLPQIRPLPFVWFRINTYRHHLSPIFCPFSKCVRTCPG